MDEATGVPQMKKTVWFGFINSEDDLTCKKLSLKNMAQTTCFFKSHQPSTSKKSLSKLFL